MTSANLDICKSSWGISCHEEGCVEKLALVRTMTKPVTEDEHWDTEEKAWRELAPALDEAAVSVGWRTYQSVWWCPTHVVTKNLACKRCLMQCPECSCMGGPLSEAVEGLEG